MSEPENLKSCPFCGGKARNCGMLDGLAQVICPHCDFAGTASEESEEEAIRLWNTRSTPGTTTEWFGAPRTASTYE